jgi:hypothetical protein
VDEKRIADVVLGGARKRTQEKEATTKDVPMAVSCSCFWGCKVSQV